jgi:nucleotide-binding universal stress UspA family protein
MQVIRSILVPLDGSSFAAEALPVAIQLARDTCARLAIATVHARVPALALATDLPVEDAPAVDATPAEVAYLQSVAAEVAPGLGNAVDIVMLEGPIPEAIAGHVAESDTDLVVMTTHGRGPLSRFWVGSVADGLMRLLHVPMLLLRPGTTSRERPAEADAPPFRRVLLALDGSPASASAIEPALMLADLSATEFILVRVVEPAIGTASLPYPVVMELDATDELERQGRAYLDGVAAGMRLRGARVDSLVHVAPSAALGILDVAERERADLIAIGTRAARGLERLMLGSVADKVVRGAHVPVLVVPPGQTPAA